MVTGPIGLVGKGIAKLFLFVFRGWWVFLTIMILFSPLSQSIHQGIEQRDIRIPLKMAGTLIVSSDEGIYEVMKDAEFEEPIGEKLMEKVDYYSKLGWFLIKNLWRHIWMLLFWFTLFFKGERFIMGEDSKSRRAFILAILTMAGLQILVYGIPFRGIYTLIKFLISRI